MALARWNQQFTRNIRAFLATRPERTALSTQKKSARRKEGVKCTVSPKNQRPEVSIAAAFRAAHPPSGLLCKLALFKSRDSEEEEDAWRRGDAFEKGPYLSSVKFPLRAEPTRAGRPAVPAPRATALGGSPAGRTGRRASRATWAPTAAGREPGPPRSWRTSPRSRRSSPARAWGGSAGCRLVSRPGCAPERPGAPSAGAGRGGSSDPGGGGWRRPGTPAPSGGGARSRAPRASPARSSPGHLLRSLRAHVTRAPSSPTPTAPSPGPAPAVGARSSCPPLPGPREPGRSASAGTPWEVCARRARPPPAPRGSPPPGAFQMRCRNGF